MVSLSPDPVIEEISCIVLSNSFGRATGISAIVKNVPSMAIDSIESINKKTLPKKAHAIFVEIRKAK